MKLNGVMVHYQLSQYFNVDYANCTQNIFAKRPIFYNDFFQMDGHVVVLRSKDIVHCVDKVKGCILVCLDTLETEVQSFQNDIIILNDPISDKIIFNILMYIYDRFDEWDSHLTEIVYKNMGFQDLLESCAGVFSEPLSLMDSNFKYVAYTSNTFIRQQFVDDLNRLPLKDVNTLTSMPGFKDLEAKEEAFTYIAGESVVYKNIFHDHQYVGRLSVLTDDPQEEEYFKALFNHLALYIEQLYAQCHGFEVAPPQLADLHQLLNKILDNQVVDPGELTHLLAANNSHPKDCYYMIQFCSNLSSGKAHNLDYLCTQMERMWPGAYCIPHKEEIAMLFNQDLFAKQAKMEFHKELVYFLRESVLLAGISRSFTDPALISSSYKQAGYALELGISKNPTRWYHYFDSYASDYLVKYGTGSFLPEQICSQELLTLRNYDRENGTSYYKTLYTYVKLQYNAVASARELYIHRSSFINRMERIREIAAFDFEDLDSRLYLLLSFRILNAGGDL